MRRVLPLVLVAALAPGLASPQSLAEAAAKEKARREQQKKKGSGQTYTDDDLPTKSKKPSPAPKGKATAQAAPTVPSEETGGNERAGEAVWRGRAHSARVNLKGAQSRIETLKDKEQQLLWQKLKSTDTNEILRLGAAQTKLHEELEEARQALATAQKELDDLQEEARRSSVPPGWLDEPNS